MNRLVGIAGVLVVMSSCKESAKPPPVAPPPPAPAKAPPPAAKAPAGKAPTAGTTVPPKHEASKVEVQAAIDGLVTKVKAGATDATNPWAMAHGLLVFGKDMKASDGTLAIDAMVRDTVVSLKVGDRTANSFVAKKSDGTPVDPHGNMIVKSLIEAGVSESRVFKLSDKTKVSLGQLADDAEWLMIVPNTDEGWERFAWTHSLLLARHKPGDAVNAKAGKKTMLELALRSVHALEAHQQELTRLMEADQPEMLKKDKTGIYGHPCGGLHFVQSTANAAKHQNDQALLDKVKKQLDVVLFRWEGERRIYREFIRTHPDARVLILVQELKFYGHVVETFALAQANGVIDLSAAQKKQLREVTGDLLQTVKELDFAYGNLDKVKASSPQTYYDLVGDGCHAIRGLREGLVAFFAE